MSPQNLTNVYNQNPTLQSQYTLQQYLDLFGGSSTGTTTPTTNTTTTTPTTPTTNASQGIINQNINQYQGGGGDKQGGGGAFGNLDISDTKTFQKDVYNSKTGMFEQQTVTGYKDPAMGNYKTFDNKNINHAGINFKGIAGMAIDALGLGNEVDEKGYYDGQISGTFTDFNFGDFSNIKDFLAAKKARQKFMDDNKKTLDAIERERLRQKAIEINAAISKAESEKQYDPNQHGGTNYGLGSDGNQSYSGDAVGAPGLGHGVSATGFGPVSNRTGKGRTGARDGGRIRSYFNGGIVSLRRR